MSIREELRRYLISFVGGPQGDRVAETIGNLGRHGTKLVTQTYDLFCTELQEKTQLLTRDAIVLLLGGAFLLVGLLAFATASIIFLSFFVPLWLAAFIISLLFSFLGLVLVHFGRATLRSRRIAPQLTIQAFRDNARWLRGHLSRKT